MPREVSNRVGRDLLELSAQIVDFPRHLGIHTGGMIIASHPLDASVPIEPATMDGRTVAQWDKDDCADAGLLKIDLLGLGMLTLIQRAFRLIEQRHGRRPALADFRFDDPKVYDAICAADTIGTFQVESRAQMHVLPQTRPRCFYDLVVQVAIIRPGPMTTKMHRALDSASHRARGDRSGVARPSVSATAHAGAADLPGTVPGRSPWSRPGLRRPRPMRCGGR